MYTHCFLTKEAQDDLRVWAEDVYKDAGGEPAPCYMREARIRAIMERLYLFETRVPWQNREQKEEAL